MTGPMSVLRFVDVQVVEKPRRLYRVSPGLRDAMFAEAFRSNYEKGLEPRGPERRAAVIHMGLSMFVSAEVTAQLAKRVPKLGGHVAMVRLAPDRGLCVAKTGQPGHWSVWGRPVELAACVEDVWKPSD